MPSLLSRLRGASDQSSRSGDWFGDHFLFNGQPLGSFGPRLTLPGSPAENVGDTFDDIVHYVRDRNGMVSAAVLARALLLSQLRFAWRNELSGRVFGDGSLAPLERPGSETRPMLLHRLEEDASYAGNAYVRRIGGRLYRLRPDWTDILIGSNGQSVAAMAQAAGVAHVIAAPVTGDVADAAQLICDQARPGITLWGGETTVMLQGTGRGGRNQELALRIAIAAADRGWGDWTCLQAGSDGRDGPTDAAGGIVDQDSLGKIADLAPLLANNDSYAALAQADGLLLTGATGTNVADLGVLIRRG
jgi:hypothetical protein